MSFILGWKFFNSFVINFIKFISKSLSDRMITKLSLDGIFWIRPLSYACKDTTTDSSTEARPTNSEMRRPYISGTYTARLSLISL